MSRTDIEQIEIDIKEAQAFVERGNALERLRHNHDFKNVILQGFLKDEAVRLVHLKADPAMQRPERQQAIEHDIRAIGSFTNYLREIERKADMARSGIEDDEATREALLAEEADA